MLIFVSTISLIHGRLGTGRPLHLLRSGLSVKLVSISLNYVIGNVHDFYLCFNDIDIDIEF